MQKPLVWVGCPDALRFVADYDHLMFHRSHRRMRNVPIPDFDRAQVSYYPSTFLAGLAVLSSLCHVVLLGSWFTALSTP